MNLREVSRPRTWIGFEHHSLFNFHFWANTHVKGMQPFILPAMG